MKVDPALASTSTSSWRSLTFLGAEPDEAIPFELVLTAVSKTPLHVADRTLGLPTQAKELVLRRAQARAAPIHLGDGVVTVGTARGQ